MAMHKTYLSSLLAVVLLAMSAGQAALAADGSYNLKFTGTIVAETCDVDSSSIEQTIDLGQFSTADFPSVGSVTKFKPFNINLKNCTQNISGAKVWFTGTQDNANPALLKLTDTGMGTADTMATGVGVEILDDNQTSIAINNSNSSVFPLKAGQNTLSFYLRYKSTLATVTAGNATAVMYFDLQYQ